MSFNSITFEEIALEDILKTRLWFYRFLHQAFYGEPNWKAFADIAHDNLFRQLQNVEENDYQSSGSSLLAETLDGMSEWGPEQWKKANEEYQRLFIGPTSLPAKPWESVYLSRERIIFDEHTLEVRAFYKNWGLEMAKLNKEPDDHIGIELEFLAELTLRALNLLQKEESCSSPKAEREEEGSFEELRLILRAQETFLEVHLCKWAAEFCSLLSENTEHPLYQGIALFTPEFLEMDFELLKDLTSLDE